MAFRGDRYALGLTVIERQGVPRDEATRLAIVPGVFEVPLVQSLLLSTVLGRARARVPGTVAPDPDVLVEVPDVVEHPFERAEAALKERGLGAKKQDVEGSGEAVVLKQEPAAGSFASRGDVVTLFVRKHATDGSPSSPQPPRGEADAEASQQAGTTGPAGQGEQQATEKQRKTP